MEREISAVVPLGDHEFALIGEFYFDDENKKGDVLIFDTRNNEVRKASEDYPLSFYSFAS